MILSATATTLSTQPAADLPDPAERPVADVVIYDGHCVFCRSQVERLARWDGKGRLTYLSLHDPRAKALCPNLSHDELMKQIYVVTPEGNQYGGAAAFRYLSRRLPRLWWLAPLMHIPFSLPLWQWIYLKVAERRYRIAGKNTECDNGSCDLHFRKK